MITTSRKEAVTEGRDLLLIRRNEESKIRSRSLGWNGEGQQRVCCCRSLASPGPAAWWQRERGLDRPETVGTPRASS
jgi:hypothetical protein